MKIAELFTEQQCDRQQIGDIGYWLWMLHKQGCPICPTLVIPVEGWQFYQQALQKRFSLQAERPNWPEVASYQEAVSTIEIPTQWLTQLTTVCQQWSAPAIALHPVLVTTPKLPFEVQQLWRSQICPNTPETIAQALSQVWQSIVNAHSLAYYRHFKIPWSELQVTILVQPLAHPLASGQLTLTPTTWQIEAVWGCGYGWLPDCCYPDYYLGKRYSTELTQHRLGSKHWVNQITPQGQLHHYCTKTTEQNQWVLAIHEIQQLLRELTVEDYVGSLLWHWLPNGRVEILQGQVSPTPDPQEGDTVAFPHAIGANHHRQAFPFLRGQGVVPGFVLATTFILTPETTTPPSQQILVATQLPTQQISVLSNAAGLILEQGAATSHAVIVARELQIPTIIGVEAAIAQLKNIRKVAIDGEQGHIYLKGEYIKSPLNSFPDNPSPATQIQIWGTVSHPQAIAALPQKSLDGIGLIRAELLLMGLCPEATLAEWLSEPEQVQAQLHVSLEQILNIMAPRPVFYRFTDWCYPDFPLLSNSRIRASNPAMGQRGMAAAQADPLIFDLELAVLQAMRESASNLNLILPFVRRVAEVEWACERLTQAGILPQELWMMAEVPAVAFELPAYQRAGIQGIIIGLNDLMQLTLGIDRNTSELGRPTDSHHPAVRALIQRLITQAQELDLSCALCASVDWSSHPFVPDLVNWGIQAIATDLGNIEAARWAIARAESRQ